MRRGSPIKYWLRIAYPTSLVAFIIRLLRLLLLSLRRSLVSVNSATPLIVVSDSSSALSPRSASSCGHSLFLFYNFEFIIFTISVSSCLCFLFLHAITSEASLAFALLCIIGLVLWLMIAGRLIPYAFLKPSTTALVLLEIHRLNIIVRDKVTQRGLPDLSQKDFGRFLHLKIFF